MLPLQLNASQGVPIYRQIMDGIRELIAVGTLAPGDRLPSIRELSSSLRINPSSAVKAYNELKHLGVIVLDQGRGTFVSSDPAVQKSNQGAILREDAQHFVRKARTRGSSDRDIAAAVREAMKEKSP